MWARLAVIGILLASAIAGAQPPPAQPGSGSDTVPVEEPPSGPGLGQQQPPPAQQPPPPAQQPPPPAQQPPPPAQQPPPPVQRPPAPPIQLSPQEIEQLKDIEAEHDRFLAAANEHDRRLREIAKHEFDARTQELDKKYAEGIAKTTANQKKHHDETIAKLEKFLTDHPNHDQYTPDAMFRLADLYLDESDAAVEERLAALEQSGQPPTPEEAAKIVADYSKSLALWEQILTKFPSYRQTPSTLYLLAYYGKTKDERKSLTVFLALACANHYKWNDKPSVAPTKPEAVKRAEAKTLRDPYADCTAYPGAELELVRHAWVRGIADLHFGTPGELDEAIAAYLKVAHGGNDSKLYAESLYKLAWSYYKRDRLYDSIVAFNDSVKLYDQVVAQGGIPQLELRDESIQYISVAFTDPWEGEADTNPVKAFERAQDFYRGHENEPHVRDVWVAMGKAFAEIQAWDQAVASYRIAIGPPWELNPKNPVVHQEIVNVYEAKGDKLAADAAAAELATKYAPGTPWFVANEKDREAMENQRRISERALYAAARNTHSVAAQMRKDYDAAKTKDPAQKQDYLAMYNKAAELYRTFLNTYPESDYVYEFNFQLGETLFYSERYMEAVEQYKWVRDHRDLGTAFYIDAARSVLASYEAEKDKLVAQGKLAELKVPTSADLKALPQPWTPQPIPDVYVKLQAEYDNYQNIVNDPAAAPTHGINAALISLVYLHVDDAIARFTKVMDKFCGNPTAARAKDGILAVYEAQSNFDAMETTNKNFINAKCGDTKAIADAIAQNRSLNFSRANALYAEKQYVAAADAFYRFYKTAPEKDPDLPVALYNAAVSYKLAERPKTAISLFKEFADKKDKAYRESPYYLDALRLQGATYQAAFDYGNAVTTYLELYDTTKKAKKLGIKAPDPLPGEQPRTLDQIGLDALFNAALASELNRDFKRAIDLYTQYGKVETDHRKQDRAMWSIIGIHRQSGDVNAMADTAGKWRAKFGNDGGNEDDFVQTYYDEAAVRKRKGQTAQANKAGEDSIAAWKKKGSQRNSRGAKLAGEWQLEFAEQYYGKTWDPYEVKTKAATVKQFEAIGNQLTAARQKVEDKYLALDQYGVAEYSMAAKVRFGDIQYGYAQKVNNVPVPTPLERAGGDALAAFLNKRDENLKKYLEEAKKQWVEVLDAGKKGGISNKWSRLAQEDLGREFPQEFTVLRQEIIQGTDSP